MSDCQFFNLRLTTILYRYTKSRLFRDKITENDKCYLCSGSQTLVHLFADCVCSKVFWTDFTSWWNCKNTTQIRLQQRDILYAFLFRHQLLFARGQKLHFCFNSYLTIFFKNKLGTDKGKIRGLVTLGHI